MASLRSGFINNDMAEQGHADEDTTWDRRTANFLRHEVAYVNELAIRACEARGDNQRQIVLKNTAEQEERTVQEAKKRRKKA